jgi:hypothetical protein
MPAYGRKKSLQFCRPMAGYLACNTSASQGCRARLHGMEQYAESMVKLDNIAVF